MASKDTKKDTKKDTSKKTITTTTTVKRKPAENVLKPEEISRVIDLGLGRGVNATVPSPWINKSTFQVREVTKDTVVGTEEGGILQSYVNEVVSVEEVQSMLSSSVPINSSVTIGVDAELSRSYSTSRKSMGKKLITRSVSFRPDFDALIEHKAVQIVAPPTDLEPTSPQVELISPQAEPPAADDEEEDPEEVRAKGAEKVAPPEAVKVTTLAAATSSALVMPTFEQRLALWIMESLLDEEFAGVEPLSPNDDPIVVLANYALKWQGERRDLRMLLKRKCREFVDHFNVTHYVSSIDLGAAQYQVLSEDQYQREVGIKNQLEILQIISLSSQEKSRFSRSKKYSQTTEIGRFDGSTVHRGTTDEAVVSVKFEPISVLVKVKVLRIALQKAIKDYIDDQEFSRAGPFIISCNDESIFLKVNSHYEVVGTTKIEESSDFYISYNEDGRSAYEFSINHMSKSPLAGREVKPVSRYLYAPVGALGKNSGPLTLQLAARDRDTVMTLRSRRVGYFEPVDTKDWMSSRDIFYISCKQRLIGRNSYIAVRRTPRRLNLTDEFITLSVPSIKTHDESRERYMLFRLLRASKRDYDERLRDNSDDDDVLGVRTTLNRHSSSAIHLPFGFRLPFSLGRNDTDFGQTKTTQDELGRENIPMEEMTSETRM